MALSVQDVSLATFGNMYFSKSTHCTLTNTYAQYTLSKTPHPYFYATIELTSAKKELIDIYSHVAFDIPTVHVSLHGKNIRKSTN